MMLLFRSPKSKIHYRHTVLIITLFFAAGGFLFPSPVRAEDATIKFKIVPPDCQVSQVVENGQVKDVFTPAGCDVPPEPVKPTVVQDNTQPNDIFVQRTSQSIVVPNPFEMPPGSLPVGVPNANRRSMQTTDDVDAKPGAYPGVSPIVLVATTGLVIAGVGVALGVWGPYSSANTPSVPHKKK